MNVAPPDLFWRAVLAAAISIAMLVGCGNDDSVKLLGSAKEYIAKNDYRAAAIQLRNVLQNNPQNAEARYLLGVSLLSTGDLLSAEKEFRRALEYGYGTDKVAPRLAETMLGLGEAKKLVAEFSATALADAAAQASLKSIVGGALLSLGQFKEARTAFEAAVSAQSDNAPARIGLARIAAMEGDSVAAAKAVEEVLAVSPGQPDALALKADLLLTQGRLDDAVPVLRDLVKASPRNLQARFTLVSSLIAGKKFEEAAAEVAAMKTAFPGNARVSYLEALYAFRKGEPAKAREPIQQVLKVAPDHLPSLLLGGAIEYQLGSFEIAESYLRRVVSASPRSAYPRTLLAATYLRNGQPGKADEMLDLALKAAPNNPTVLRLAGEVALANNQVAEALKYYEQAAAADKQDTALQTRAAQVRLASGDTDRAMRDLEAISGLDDANYQADISLIAGHLSKKEYDKATAAVAALEKKQPANPLTFNLKGVVQLARQDEKAARESFQKALSLQFNYLPAARNLAALDLAAKQPDAARSRYEAILAKEPGNQGALLALAEIQARTGASVKDVAATLERAIVANPQAPAPRLALISLHLSARDPQMALRIAQAATAALPGSPGVLEALGIAQLASGDSNQAISTFNKLVEMLPTAPGPLARLASAYTAAKQFDPAIQALRRALALQPDSIEIRRQLIGVQVAASRFDDAMREAREVQKKRPKESEGFVLEGEVLAAQKKFLEAAAAFSEGMKRQPQAALVVRQHQMLVAAGRVGDADVVSAQWLKQNPKDVALRLYLANRDIQEKDYRAAAKRYQEIIALQQDNALALNNLAWALHELKDPAALGYAEKAYKLAPGSASVADTYGWLLVNQGETARGIELLTQAVKTAPGMPTIQLHLAKARLKTGDKAGAREVLENILKLRDAAAEKAEAEQLLKTL